MKYKPSDFARHMAALAGCQSETRHQFFKEFGRPDKNDAAGQAKYEQYLLDYMKGIDEKMKQTEMNF